MNFNVIVTLGPSSLKAETLKAIDRLGSCIYRINGAHADAAKTRKIVKSVRAILGDPEIMIDLPGNKIRIQRLRHPIPLKAGQIVEIRPENLNYPEMYRLVKPGDVLHANDATCRLEFRKLRGKTMLLKPQCDGKLLSNKGIHLKGCTAKLPFLFTRDLELLDVADQLQVDYICLSFVRSAMDIQTVKTRLSRRLRSEIELISKIETQAAVENLNSILEEVRIINVDRGDLASEVGLLNISPVQDHIVETALQAGKDVYLATQFLKNMETHPVPLIAESLDLYNTVRSGVLGIQLSEETAIGRYPIQAVKQIFETVSAAVPSVR